MHGVGSLFSAAYGNVGSSIYYALGVVALYALGLTPVTFMIAGLIFAFTAASYAEATVMYPEAGGSSSFARHAFNEGVSFFAAWGQMLTYIVTIAISAFFVPHYLAVFWDPLGHGPGDVFFALGLVALLALLNIKGTEESARLNLVLALADLATQIVLAGIGIALVLDPDLLVSQVDLGVAPTWGDFLLGIAVGMVAYTGIETISNMAEEARDAKRTIPRGVGATVAAVLGLYALLPAIALSAMPVTQNAAGEYSTDLGTKFADDPVLGIVENLGLSQGLTDGLRIYVGILAAVILLIATNAGLIGVSRLTFSMGQHRQLPETLRQIHPRFKTPYMAIIIFSIFAGLTIIPGETTFLATLYSFGATLSFTIAHVSVIRLRQRRPNKERPWKPPGNIPIRGVEVPITAVLGGIGTFGAFVVAMALDPVTLATGGGWMCFGMVLYVAYRKHQRSAAAEDGEGRDARAGRGRGGRVQQHPGRLRRRHVLRGGDLARGRAGREARTGDPRAVGVQRPDPPPAGRRARGRGARGADEDRTGEADLRTPGHRSGGAGAAGSGGDRDRQARERDQGGGDRDAAALPQRGAALRKDAADRAESPPVPGDHQRPARRDLGAAGAEGAGGGGRGHVGGLRPRMLGSAPT